MSDDMVIQLRDLAELLSPENTTSEAGLWLICDKGAAEIESLRDRLSFAEFEWHRATDGMKERDAEIETLRVQLASAHDACLTLCGNHSFATGHGDTVADIIGEIDGQIARCAGQLAKAKACLKNVSEFVPSVDKTLLLIQVSAAKTYAGETLLALSDETGKS